MKRVTRNFGQQLDGPKARLVVALLTLSMFLLSAGAPVGLGSIG